MKSKNITFVLAVIFLGLFLASQVHAPLSETETDIGSDQKGKPGQHDSASSFSQSVSSAVSSGRSFSGRSDWNLDLKLHGWRVHIPIGAFITVNSEGVHISKIKSAKKGKEKFGKSKGFFIGKNKKIKVENTELFDDDNDNRISISNPVNLEKDDNKISFFKAKNVQIGKWYFDELGQSEFEFENKKLKKARIKFLTKKEYRITNILSNETTKILKPTQLIDSDLDGLSDTFEKANGFNKRKKDTDGDGLTDYEEVMIYPTDPTKKDSYTTDSYTSDSSFVTFLKSNPTVFGQVISDLGLEEDITLDTDSDGISDINEYRYGMDPTTADMDKDGFSDGFELVRGMDSKKKNSRVLQLSESCTDCIITLEGEKDSEVTVDIAPDIITYNLINTNFNLKDQNYFIQSSIINTAQPASVTMKKVAGGYNITTVNNNQRIYSNDYVEELEGEVIRYSADINDGVVFVELPSPGIYRYVFLDNPDYLLKDAVKKGLAVQADKSFAQSFEIERPEDLTPYSLTIEKPSIRKRYDQIHLQWKEGDSPYYWQKGGYVSLLRHKLLLNGIINYNRLNFELLEKLKTDLGQEYLVLEKKDNSYYSIIQSKRENNKLLVRLDDNNVFLNVIKAENKEQCSENFQLFVIKSGRLELEEVCTPLEVQSLGDFTNTQTPYVIDGIYQAEFKDGFHPALTFSSKNRTLTQPKSGISKSNTVMIPEDSPLHQASVKKAQDYEDFVTQLCGGLNQYFKENEI